MMEKTNNRNIDYIDGILFSKTKGVLMTGSLQEHREGLPRETFSKASDEWYALHVKKKLQEKDRWEEAIPVADYLFRYDRGAFWTGEYAFQKSFGRFGIPFNRLTRFLVNPLLKAKFLYRALNSLGLAYVSQRYIVQDIVLPNETIETFLEYIDRRIKTYPLWILPLNTTREDKLCPSCIDSDLAISVGLWDGTPREFSEFRNLNKEIESKTLELGGRKTLYAHSYYTKEEFWSIYDREWYRSLRTKYQSNQALPNIYETISVSKRYRRLVKQGMWDLIKSPFKIPTE